MKVLYERLRRFFYPRLGNLDQYSPTDLTSHQVCLIRPANLTAFPKVSIVTPSFNQGDFIGETIESVLSQKYKNLEYYIQDGGSKDSTIDVLKHYEAHLAGWVSNKDNGQSHAINLGFSNTRGEIMAWLNSDDLLLPWTIEIVVDFFNRNPDVDVVYVNRLLINENGKEIGRWILPDHDGAVLSWADYVPQETLFWRRSIWNKVGGIDESYRFAMDWDLLVRFRSAGAVFAHIPQFLGAFRIHSDQKTSAAINDIGFEEMDRIRKSCLGKVPGHKEINRSVMIFMLRHLFHDFYFRLKKVALKHG